MDNLVGANAGAFAAYLERAIYRIAAGSWDDAEKDAARARQLAPNDAPVLRTAAEIAARRGHTDDARTALQQGLKAHPDDMDLRLALAALELRSGQAKEAADCLEEGKDAQTKDRSATDESERINLLAEARLQLGQTEAVEARAAEERAAGRTGAADYLTARLRMYENRWSEAAQALEKTVKASSLSLDQIIRTRLCLAACYKELGDGDRRLTVLRQAAAAAPFSAPAGAALGAALLDLGRTEEALDQLWRTVQLPQGEEEAWPLLARALLQHNQTLPPNKQDWATVDRALDHCGPSPEAARLRAAALRARGEPAQATALLERTRAAHPDDSACWTAQALDSARRGDADGAEKILEAAQRRLGDRVEFRLARLRIAVEAEDGTDFKTLSDLENGLDGYAPQDRTLLLCRLAESYYRIGKTSDGDRLCRFLAAAPAQDLSDRVLLLEAALPCEDDALLDGVLADVARLEGEDGAWTRFGRAARLLVRAYRGDRSGLAEAKTLLDELAQRRPDWSRAALLQGRLAEVNGDSTAALDAYRRAFDQGERRPDVARTLAHLLTERGRWDEADQVFRLLQEQTVFHGDLARLATETALQAHNGERAVELARLAAPVADVYTYHAWLGRILAAAGRPDEAEAELRRAAHFTNAGWDATQALASLLAGQGRMRDAETAVEELKASLPERYAALPLAVCYEAAGRLDLAGRYYDEELALRPDDARTLVRAAALHVRLNQPARAETVLRRLLDSGKDASTADLAWVRRELEMLLAADGDDAKYAEATTLLSAPSDAGPESRSRAFVLGARSSGRAEAIRRLEEERKTGPLPPDEEFRLVQLYEADGQWPAASDRLASLITVDKQNPEYLAHLVEGLLLHDQAEEAGPWVERLETLEPGSERVKTFRARIAATTKTAVP